MFPREEKETTEEKKQRNKKSLRGVFNQYADASKILLEDSAWQNHIISKYK